MKYREINANLARNCSREKNFLIDDNWRVYESFWKDIYMAIENGWYSCTCYSWMESKSATEWAIKKLKGLGFRVNWDTCEVDLDEDEKGKRELSIIEVNWERDWE